MEIAILVACIIVYIIVGIIITINEPKSVALKVIFAPAELVFLCLGGLGLFIGWLTKKVRMLIDSDYAEKTRLENKQNQIKQQLNDNYSDIGYTIRRETEEEERKKEQAEIELKEKREKEEIEKERIRKAKEQAEIELKEKREKEEIEKRISFFENSEATKKIVEYIKTKSSGTPHTITIDTFNLAEQKTKKRTTITFYFEGGHGSYNFSEFNLKSLEMPEDTETFSKSASQEDVSKWFLNKWSKKNNAYYLAAAINRHFNNQFKIEELFYSNWSTPHNVVESDSTTRTYEMANINAKLTREMRSF